MAHIDAAHVQYTLPDGRPLLTDVSLRLPDGSKSALIGPNGAGKTTLLRMLAGDLAPQGGSISHTGELAVMHQFVGQPAANLTVRHLLGSVAPAAVRKSANELTAAEAALETTPSESVQLRYAQALADWNDAGGYHEEALWDECCVAAIGRTFPELERRQLSTFSGGEQKRLMLEALLRGEANLLLLDEPDNFLDVPSKRWLESRLIESKKTVLLISHDREMLDRCAQRIITLEAGTCWIHGESFSTYAKARSNRYLRMEELLRRWTDERDRLRQMVRNLRQQASISADMASRYHAAETRLHRFEQVGPPQPPPPPQAVKMRLGGGRTGVKSLSCEKLELTGLMRPFDLEVFYGERLAILGSNGSGKSRFLQLIAGGGSAGSPAAAFAPALPANGSGASPSADGRAVPHSGNCKLGARVVPGYFAQTYELPTMGDSELAEILSRRCSLGRGPAISALRRYELDLQADQPFDNLSGGQKARFQILLLELSGATLLVLDEPTGNLDLVSAQALEDGLAGFQGTVVAVTHDRWFARSFGRYLVFEEEGSVRESAEPVWDAARVRRPGPV
jgi:ATPase subunit of ABC transporter with duplicated ATPase domains